MSLGSSKHTPRMKVKRFWLVSAASASPVSSMVRVPARVLVVLMTPTAWRATPARCYLTQSISSQRRAHEL